MKILIAVNKQCVNKEIEMIAIEFKKLFGRFDYNVVLNKDGLTILTGPNGYGKSTILKSIESIGNGWVGILYFLSLDFKRIKVLFDNDKSIVVEKKDDTLLINDVLIKGDVFRHEIERILERRPFLLRLDEDTWVDRRRGIKYLTDEYLMDYIKDQQHKMQIDNAIVFTVELRQLMENMKELLGEIYFIREQRLIKTNRNREYEQEVVNIIEELPKKFRDLIGNVQQDYSAISSKLDSTYPNRLFDNEEGINEDEYKLNMQEMTSKFEKMRKYDLSTMQMTTKFVFKEEHAKALKIYFDDFNEKYSVYEDFIQRLELYTDIINNRLSFKEIRISKKNGIDIVDDHDKRLRLEQLSSGEKQEIVLFYELIFGTQKNVLLMIDEPEISLHITWQKKFMDDLLRIIDYKHINVIVATHSPQIINNHWERQIDLGELYGKQLNKK